MTSLVPVEAVERLLTTPLESDEHEFVTGLIEEAIDAVEAYTRRDFRAAGTLPGQVSRVVARMVARSLEQGEGGDGIPSGATNISSSAGPFSRSFGFDQPYASSGVWLTRQDKMRLRRYRGGAFTIHLG